MTKLFALCASLLLATPAQAQVVKWGSAAGWSVDVDKPSRNCGLSRDFSKGTRLLVMYDRASKQFTMSFSNDNWAQYLAAGDTYAMNLVMDGVPWKAQFTAIRNGNARPFLMAVGLKSEFLGEFMRRNTIAIYNATSGAFVTSLPLDGSTAAMTEMLACQRAMNGEES